MAQGSVKNYCAKCCQTTNHEIIGIHTYNEEPEVYACCIEHAVVKCLGCETVSFRRTFHDFEGAYPDDFGEWITPVTIDVYPRKTKGKLNLNDAPEMVGNIYAETCSAFGDGLHTLAGIGFRATIEAICTDQNIAGKDLSTKINNLATKGLISKKDSKRLHSIRFLGNDAVHDLKTPSTDALEAALTIIEHLLTTIYILDTTTNGKLEEIIDQYEVFEKILLDKLKAFSKGDDYPIQKYLGKDMRLLSGSTKSLEQQLISNISKGIFLNLKISKKCKFQNSKEDLQHFQVT